jgi:hypothetical protein
VAVFPVRIWPAVGTRSGQKARPHRRPRHSTGQAP